MDDLSPETKTGKEVLALGLMLAIGIALRLFRLDFQSLWFDEVSSVLFAKQPTIEGVISYIKGDFHPPFYYLLLHFWIILVGQSDFSVRLLSCLISIAGLLSFYRISALFLPTKAQLIATAFCTLSLFNIWYGQEVRAYGLVMLLSILSMHYSLLYRRHEKISDLASYIAWSAILLYTHYFAVFLLITQNIVTLRYYLTEHSNNGTRSVIRWLLAQALIGISFLPWLPIFVSQLKAASGSIWIPEPTLELLLTLPLRFITYRELSDIMPTAILLSGLILIVLALWFRFSPKRTRTFIDADSSSLQFKGYITDLTLWLTLPTLLSYVSSYFWVNTFYFRNLIISAPALYIFLAALTVRPKLLMVRLFILSTVIGLSTVSYRWYFTKHHKEDWRSATNLIDTKGSADDQLIFEGPWTRMAFEHYTTKTSPNVILLSDEPTSKVIWVIKAESDLKESSISERLKQSNYRLHRTERFPGITVLKFFR